MALLETESAFTRKLIERMNDPGTEWMGQWAGFHGENPPAQDPPAQEKNQPRKDQDNEYQ